MYMGNFCNKLYYSIPQKQKCFYCNKQVYISETETSKKISTQGCRVCRIKMKYYFKPIRGKQHLTNSFIENPECDKIYNRRLININNEKTTQVKGRYY